MLCIYLFVFCTLNYGSLCINTPNTVHFDRFFVIDNDLLTLILGSGL